MTMRKKMKPIVKATLLGLAVYVFIGLVFTAGSLYCYNARNWKVHGGFSLPPLFVPGFLLEILLWPLFLWANLINRLGPLGICTPL